MLCNLSKHNTPYTIQIQTLRMPINTRAAAVFNFTLRPRAPVPLIRGWNRLEGRPRSDDFSRSLKSEVRDPLWFLTRQWQFGEFEGNDAGSPIDARIAYQASPLSGYAVSEQTLPYDATHAARNTR